MKNIEDYIKKITTKSNIKYDYLDNIVLDHCYIHYVFNYRLVTESNIYETSTSKFPGQDKLVKDLIDNISYNKITSKISVNTNYVKDIYIHLDINSEEGINGGYVYDNSKYDDYNEIRWDSINKRFNFIEIYINNYNKDPNGLEELLYHETKHMWDDYQLMLHNNINFKNVIKIYHSKDDIIRDILYFSDKYEISAYLSQLNKVLGNFKYDNIKNALNDIIKSSIYKNYKDIYYVLTNDLYKDELLKEISNKEYNKIKKNIQIAWHKIIHHIYIICGEHINENRMVPTVIGYKTHINKK